MFLVIFGCSTLLNTSAKQYISVTLASENIAVIVLNVII